MSKRRKLFHNVIDDSVQTKSEIFRNAYKIGSYGSVCPAKTHKNIESNPWCLHGLGREEWLSGERGLASGSQQSEQHFSLRSKQLDKYSGLRNLGATCYVNSLCQVLFHNLRFRNALYNHTPTQDDTGKVILTLQQLMVDLEWSNRGVIDTADLVSALQLPTAEQQDVVEFGELLFSMLTNSIPNLQDHNKGTGCYLTRCLTCGNVTRRPSDFTDLKLQVAGKGKSLSERIAQLRDVEILEGDNRVNCGQCDALCRVERCFMIETLPQTLQLQLLRFNYNTSTMQRTKDTSYVKFKERFTLYNLTGSGGSNISRSYQLSSVVLHVGESTQSGHYIAIVLKGNKWVTFNDDTVVELDTLDLRQYDLSAARRPGCDKGEFCSQSVYMLVYEDESEIQTGLEVTNPISAPPPTHSGANSSPLTDSTSGATSSSTAGPCLDARMGKPPPELLRATLEDNEEFQQLSELLVEQREGIENNAHTKAVWMMDACCRLEPDNQENFIPLPTNLLKAWLTSGEKQLLRPTLPPTTTTTALEEEEEEFPALEDVLAGSEITCTAEKGGTTQTFCPHGKLSYHQLKEIKYINTTVIPEIVIQPIGGTVPLHNTQFSAIGEGSVQISSESRDTEIEVKTERTSDLVHCSVEPQLERDPVLCDKLATKIPLAKAETEISVKSEVGENAVAPEMLIRHEHVPNPPVPTDRQTSERTVLFSLGQLVLCEECVQLDLRKHLYDTELDTDYKVMQAAQEIERESGWWVIKEDFKNFKRIIRQGQNEGFNQEVLCRHGQLEPEEKRRKLVSVEIKPVVQKYIPQFHAPNYSLAPCQACSDESDSERNYFSALLLLKKELSRLISDAAFPYIPGLTPFFIPTRFIYKDLQPLYKRKLQERISLDNNQLICKHGLLASDSLQHAAFVKESEWDLLSTHFGPTTPLQCVTDGSGLVTYSPGVCTDCVMLHDAFFDQLIYLREDKTTPGKRGRRGDKLLHVSSSHTVQDVKVQICRKMAIAPSEQTLSTEAGKVLERGTMRELGVTPGSVLYLEYSQPVYSEQQIFTTEEEQGFKGTVLSGL